MSTYVIVRFTFEGIHSWPGAPEGPEEYLRYNHRHLFHVEAKKSVPHEERAVEIIALRRDMSVWASNNFGGTPTPHSCETMARRFLEKFKLTSCSVLEDNENGAEVTAD